MLFKKHTKPNLPVTILDKRDYVLSSPKIKDDHVRTTVNCIDSIYKSITEVYDRIIIDAEVNSKNITKIINKIEDQLNTIKEDLNG